MPKTSYNMLYYNDNGQSLALRAYHNEDTEEPMLNFFIKDEESGMDEDGLTYAKIKEAEFTIPLSQAYQISTAIRNIRQEFIDGNNTTEGISGSTHVIYTDDVSEDNTCRPVCNCKPTMDCPVTGGTCNCGNNNCNNNSCNNSDCGNTDNTNCDCSFEECNISWRPMDRTCNCDCATDSTNNESSGDNV